MEIEVRILIGGADDTSASIEIIERGFVWKSDFDARLKELTENAVARSTAAVTA